MTPASRALHAAVVALSSERGPSMMMRSLRAAPIVSLAVILSLGLGLGANVAIFSVANRLLLQPLPVDAPDRLVNLTAPGPKPGSTACTLAGACDAVFSYPMFRDLERVPHDFTGIAAHRVFRAAIRRHGEETVPSEGLLVSGRYFDVLGLRPALGMLLTPDDDRAVGESSVVVLAYDAWRRWFDESPAVLGTTLFVNGQPLVIIGVAPRGFEGTTRGARPDVFVPLTMRGRVEPPFAAFENRTSYWLYVFARLRPGVSIERATLAHVRDTRITLTDGRRGQSTLLDTTRPWIALLWTLTAIVVLIACANLANLMLARSTARTGDIAIRLALGARPTRVMRDVLRETTQLALAGGLVGLLAASWTLSALGALLPEHDAALLRATAAESRPMGALLARDDGASAMQAGDVGVALDGLAGGGGVLLDPTVLLFAFALSVGVGVLAGVIPAAHVMRVDVAAALRAHAPRGTSGRGAARVRHAIVVAQMALATGFLGAAGLFARSLANVDAIPLGLDVDRLVTFTLAPERSGASPVESRRLFARVEQGLTAIPGVGAVAATRVPIFSGGGSASVVRVQGAVASSMQGAVASSMQGAVASSSFAGASPSVAYNEVSAGYFRAMGIPLLAGREFTTTDGLAAPAVAVVNEAFLHAFGLDRRDVVGRRLTREDRGTGGGDVEIVGVVRDARSRHVRATPPPMFFVPYRQNDLIGSLTFYLRTTQTSMSDTSTSPDTLFASLRRWLAEIEPTVPLEGLRTMRAVIRDDTSTERALALLSTVLAALAMLLAIVGLHATLIVSLAQRAREIAVRTALGATPARIRTLILGQPLWLIVIGALAGLAIAVATGRTAGALLYDVSSHDPFVLAAAAVTPLSLALLAAYLPGRRTLRLAHVMRLAAILILLLPATAAAQVDALLYAPDGDNSIIRRISTATRQETLPLNVGTTFFHVTPTPDGRLLFVLLSSGRALAVIDAATAQHIDTIALTADVSALVMSPDGRFLHVLDEAFGIVTFDVATRRPAGTRIVMPARAANAAISPDGQRLCVTHGREGGDDLISFINLTARTVERTVIPDSTQFTGPSGAIFTSDGQAIWVKLPFLNSVVRIDARSGVVGTPITVGENPRRLALTPDDRILYVSHGNRTTPLSVIDTTTRTIVATPALPLLDWNDYEFDMTPNGRELYVRYRDAGSGRALAIIDTTSHRVVETLRLNQTGDLPAIAMSPALLVPAATPLGIASDAELTARGFRAFLPFNGGTLSLNADWSTTRAVSLLAAGVFNAGGTIDMGNTNATISGRIFGEGALTKRGPGTLTINDATHPLGTTVQLGTLVVNGTHEAGVTLDTNSTLGGTGHVGTIFVPRGGRIDPGPVNGVGTLHALDVTMNRDTTLAIDLHGPAEGAFDRLDVDKADLSDGTLLLRPAFTPRLLTTFTIVSRDDGDGTFLNLPDAQVIHTTRGDFRIKYRTGASGHDVTLTTVATPTHTAPTISGLVDRTIPFGTATPTPIAFTVNDDLTRADLLTVTVTSSNPAAVDADKIDIEVDGATRRLLPTLAPTAAGTTTITVTVSDGDLTTTASFELSVEFSYLLAEGATGRFFDTDILIANPNDRPVPMRITFFPQGGPTTFLDRTLTATSRTTIRVDELAGLENLTGVSSVVTAAYPLVVERTMRWDASGYGSHTDKATTGAATRWYFAEGSQGFFSTFFLLVNPDAAANTAHVTYFREQQPPVQRTYSLGPSSRLTIDAGSDSALVNTSFGALVEFERPGVAERAMYFGTSPLWTGGHESAGVTAPATSWFLAEGATGSYFNTYVLLANPGDQPATVTLTFLPAIGAAVSKKVGVPAGQRVTIDIAAQDATLADAAVATRVESDVPLVVERAQYWPNPAWHEAHDSFGVTETATRWGLAEGRVGGSAAYQTYILLANPGTEAADVRITFLRATGAPLEKTFRVAPESRFNVGVTGPGPGSLVPELQNESFGAVITSTQPIAVERSLYNNANGVIWAAGTNATATRLPLP